jgi:multicomponent Na+:H+ antiporter subunit G
MITSLLQTLGLIALLLGTIFSILGILGLLRLPDVYTRLHATGKVSVYGTVLLLIAAISLTPLSLGKGLVLIALLLLSAPAVAHAIASAAYQAGIPMKSAGRDDLRRRSPRAGKSENRD